MIRNRRPDSGDRKQVLACPVAQLGPMCMAVRGRLGDRVYKTYGTRIIITRVPRFDGYVPSAAQRDRRGQMRAATAFAHAVYSDPAAKAVYVAAARILGRQPFRLAVSDFMRGCTRISPVVPCPASSSEKSNELAQGSHASAHPVGRAGKSQSVLCGNAETRRKAPSIYSAPPRLRVSPQVRFQQMDLRLHVLGGPWGAEWRVRGARRRRPVPSTNRRVLATADPPALHQRSRCFPSPPRR